MAREFDEQFFQLNGSEEISSSTRHVNLNKIVIAHKTLERTAIDYLYIATKKDPVLNHLRKRRKKFPLGKKMLIFILFKWFLAPFFKKTEKFLEK